MTLHVQNRKMENSGHRYGTTTTVRENYNPLDYFNQAFLRQAKKEEQKQPATQVHCRPSPGAGKPTVEGNGNDINLLLPGAQPPLFDSFCIVTAADLPDSDNFVLEEIYSNAVANPPFFENVSYLDKVLEREKKEIEQKPFLELVPPQITQKSLPLSQPPIPIFMDRSHEPRPGVGGKILCSPAIEPTPHNLPGKEKGKTRIGESAKKQRSQSASLCPDQLGLSFPGSPLSSVAGLDKTPLEEIPSRGQWCEGWVHGSRGTVSLSPSHCGEFGNDLDSKSQEGKSFWSTSSRGTPYGSSTPSFFRSEFGPSLDGSTSSSGGGSYKFPGRQILAATASTVREEKFENVSRIVRIGTIGANPGRGNPINVGRGRLANQPITGGSYFCDLCAGWWFQTNAYGIRWMHRFTQRMEGMQGWCFHECEFCG